jgi:hypothetical protein
MKAKTLAIATAMALSGAALAQTGSPGSTAPTTSPPGMGRSGSGMTPGMSSSGATGSTEPSSPNGTPDSSGKARNGAPNGTSLPYYIVPAHPQAPSGDDGSTAGKTNPD